jgi:hypothetical protein
MGIVTKAMNKELPGRKKDMQHVHRGEDLL